MEFLFRDTYTGMIFESYVPEIDIAPGGGGRYDKLIELFRAERTPAVGVAPGIDRLVLAMKKQRVPAKIRREKRVMVIPVDEQLEAKAFELSTMLSGGDKKPPRISSRKHELTLPFLKLDMILLVSNFA